MLDQQHVSAVNILRFDKAFQFIMGSVRRGLTVYKAEPLADAVYMCIYGKGGHAQ